MRYTKLKKQNKALKATIAILSIALAVTAIALSYTIANNKGQWDGGFNACIEENNLYNRYY